MVMLRVSGLVGGGGGGVGGGKGGRGRRERRSMFVKLTLVGSVGTNVWV